VPVATTVNVTLPPADTVALDGFVVMVGATACLGDGVEGLPLDGLPLDGDDGDDGDEGPVLVPPVPPAAKAATLKAGMRGIGFLTKPKELWVVGVDTVIVGTGLRTAAPGYFTPPRTPAAAAGLKSVGAGFWTGLLMVWAARMPRTTAAILDAGLVMPPPP
jgi:hypothetical protein